MKTLENVPVKNILSALAVPFFGFALWNVIFMLFALLVRVVLLFLPVDFVRTSSWFMPLMLILFDIAILALSWFIFRLGLPDLMKAVYATVPLAVIFVSIGIFTFPWSALAYGLNGFVFGMIIGYLYYAKKPWIYLYTTVFVAGTLLIFTLLGGEI